MLKTASFKSNKRHHRNPRRLLLRCVHAPAVSLRVKELAPRAPGVFGRAAATTGEAKDICITCCLLWLQPVLAVKLAEQFELAASQATSTVSREGRRGLSTICYWRVTLFFLMCKSHLLYLKLIDVFKRKNGGTAHWCTSLRLRWNGFAAWDPGSWMCQSRSHSRGLPDGRTVEYWRWKNQLMWNSSARTDVKLCHQKHPWTSLWETASVRTFISPQSLKKI